MIQITNNSNMTPEQFCYWLQGYFEMSEAKELSIKQVKIIKDHLSTVFNKVTSDYAGATLKFDSSAPLCSNVDGTPPEIKSNFIC